MLPTVWALKPPTGPLVELVNPGSPADLAGMRKGDIVLEVDGKTVESSNALLAHDCRNSGWKHGHLENLAAGRTDYARRHAWSAGDLGRA